MNHYERLKVSQDAPPEVIRAAYRALAAKLHPDRQQQGGTDTGPDDAMHTQMAALNQAYEVLIDPKLRLEYDATLAPSRPTVAEPSGLDAAGPDLSREPAATRVDMDWLTPKAAASPVYWPPTQRTMMLGGVLVAAVALLGGSWLYKMEGQHRMERALSDQYTQPTTPDAGTPEVTAVAASASPADISAAERIIEQEVAAAEKRSKSAGGRRPSVEELSRMSDEELLKVLPTLDGKGTAGAESVAVATAGSKRATAAVPAPAPTPTPRSALPSVHHPLDGKPLGLRADMQLPEVAPAQSGGKAGR
ncbi:MAG: J domain-containing protein [Aquabacterium sp.]|uniref:J domain-containing protein n=1 Tax=Aquabacterium sp. TaxID=1872578 RepID=UPI0025BCC74A|nr:J domain-containing protein [Aquabacterium sp.]MBI3381433.1 J domain-containing protein [Aquabacterium sp.]